MKKHLGLIILSIGLVISLGLNVYCLLILNGIREMARQSVAELRVRVQELGTAPLRTQVSVDQEIPISMTVTLDRTFDVPIDTSYPLSTVVHTNLEIPLLGTQDIPIPIQANLPIKMNAQIPIRTDFPLSTTYRLKTELPIEVQLPPEALSQWVTMLSQAEDALK